MRKLLFMAFLLLTASLLLAQTDVSGDVSGTWTAANSPYNVTGNITLQQSDVLTIEPGVQVIFQGHYKFDVYGRLLAIGNDTNHILFTANDQATGWGGIRFSDINTNGQDTTKVFYCDFQYGIANGSESSGGAIYLKNSDVYFKYINVSNNQANGYGGGIYIEESSPILHHVEVFNNEAIFDGGGIYCGFNSHPNFYRVAVAHNHTQWNGGGIAFFNNCDTDLINVTIADNNADQEGQGISVVYQTSINILSSIFWGNGYPEIYYNSSSYVNATYSDIQNGNNQSYFGDGCVSADPLFVNPSNNDYTLNGHSPCINSGSPDAAYYDPDGTRADMGAYYFAISGIMGNVRINLAEGDEITSFADVTVILDGDAQETTTPDENGVYYFELTPGDYTVTATLPGYYLSPADPIAVHVDSGVLTIVSQDLVFSPPLPGTVWGYVDLTGNGNVPDISIDIDGVTTNPFPVYVGDQIDHYEYSVNVPSGHHRLVASLIGYEDYAVEDFIVVPSEMVRVDIHMTPATIVGYVSGHITLKGADGTGTGPGNVEDVIISDGVHTSHPDASGNFTLTTYSGYRDITASLGHYNSVKRRAIVLPDQTTTGLDFVLLNWDPISGNQYVMTVFSTITYDGDFLIGEKSNSVAIFGPGGYTDCRGWGTWMEGNHPGWNTDVMFYDLPGYWYLTPTSNIIGDPYNQANCEQLTFVFYNSDNDEVNTCYGTLGFVDGYNMVINLDSPSPATTQDFSLINDWNWISFNVVPADNTVNTLFASLVPNDIHEIKWEGKDAQYWNPTWVGDLTNIQMNYGLKVFMNNPSAFSVTGEKINSIVKPIVCHADTANTYNYNWVAYYPYEALPIGVALANMKDKALSVKSQNKSAVHVNDAWIGDLTVMEPGKSYLIDVAADNTMLIYPTERYYGNLTKNTQTDQVNNPANWELISGNNTNMIFMADLGVDDSEYAAGIFDENGNCRSIGKYTANLWYFTVLGDDTNNLKVKVFDKIKKEIIDTKYTFQYEANTVIGNPEKPIKIEFDHNSPANDVSLTLLKGNYPNPFNPTTEIQFNIPESGKVKLSVYNLKGELVETLINKEMTSGIHNITWNASKYGSGIYFYKIQFNGKSEMRKCIMLK